MTEIQHLTTLLQNNLTFFWTQAIAMTKIQRLINDYKNMRNSRQKQFGQWGKSYWDQSAGFVGVN